jgi:hypothetical protein
MPTHLMLRCAWQFEDTDPKNQAVMTPHFRHQFDPLTLTGVDATALATDLATALMAWAVPGTKKLTVTAYDVQGAKPNYPLAKVTQGTGPTPLNSMSQQACCLSFYGTRNIPRERGRLYTPSFLLANSAVDFSLPRISSVFRSKVAALVPIFASLGGSNVDWIVWSRVGNKATRVENYFVDEGWDIQRRRKLKSTARTTGTTTG